MTCKDFKTRKEGHLGSIPGSGTNPLCVIESDRTPEIQFVSFENEGMTWHPVASKFYPRCQGWCGALGWGPVTKNAIADYFCHGQGRGEVVAPFTWIR